ncbi:RNA ligase [Bernardetia litoralis DSM 6794]|uniref:RNA ligase n=1 Tax=Bernardetia litoralis (strain ATCC 23117 / DSM 6794 / NBRC 15988 / NCIMB 1366 / Fx l1 / Sio-4) TaxID=880071 RepID=I4AJD6_BERLS|nr:RNA ligase family protein [Bernardetia litoralis]AFM04071.1 RNA ligase [Bernardetia litoralis DSM 6794]
MKSQNTETSYYKYPRTFHLPYSPKRGSDDKVLIDDTIFEEKYIIVMEKMDGENTSIYPDYLHARSIDSTKDESHRWIERFRNAILPQVQELKNWRICGENLFYKHTIFYQNLESIFLAYSIWLESEIENQNYSLSWKETKIIFDKIGISYPKIIYEGIYDKKKILKNFEKYKFETQNKEEKNRQVEGFVIRLKDSFLYEDFSKSVAKYVCDDFEITSSKHWRYEAKTLNQLRNNQNVWTKIL